MARLVLVHGAFAGAWKWSRLIEPLQAAGHAVEAIDLPGSGADQTPIEHVTLDAYVDRVIEQLEERPAPAVLVASSMGGVVVTQTAARRPELVAGLVYVAAFAPRDGQSLLALTQLPEGADDQVQANLVVEGEPPVGKMSREASRSAAYLETTDEDFEWADPQHRPQPLQPFGATVRIPAGSLDSIPRAYVLCTLDCSIPPALQRRMIDENGIEHVIEIETDHSPMVSRTQELAEAIDELLGRMGVAEEAVR
jgi:pimeloyl-ACP methyl ester carboxylesterase